MNFPLDALCRCGDEYSSHVGGSCDEIYCRCLEFEPTGQFANEVAPDEVAPDDDVSLPSLARPVESADAKLSSTSAQLRQVQQALAASQADITQVERQLADAEGERMKAERERDEARAATERWADRAARALTSLTATREQRDLARAELEQLREALAAARDDRDFVEREMTGAREELARSDRRHLDLDSELARARTELRTLRDHQEIRAQVIRERNAELRAIRQALGIDMLVPPPDAVETIRELRAAQGWIVARDGGRDCVRCEQEIRRGEAYELMPGVDELQHVHCPTPEPKES